MEAPRSHFAVHQSFHIEEKSMRLFQLVFAVLILSWGGAVEAAPSKFVRQSTPVPGEYIGYNLWEFPATSNTSNARMLYWDEGVCP
jgi:hypothetical protein